MQRWRIPLSDVDLGPEEEAAVLRVLRSGWLTLGAEVEAFEREFAQACDAEDAVLLSSCTAALHLACLALGVGPGDEVIVPTLTFVATANAVILAGGRPVLADSRGGNEPGIDPEAVRRLVTPATRGVICMHYGGAPCRLDELQAICAEHHLFLIEDAAHSPGGHWHGQALGTVGDVGCFSFFGNKNLTTGEGGMAAARDPQVTARIRLLRAHGMTTTSWDRFRGHAFDYDVIDTGLNYRPTELAAAIGRVQLGKLADNNTRRRKLLERYATNLTAVPGLDLADTGDRDGAGHLAVALLADRAGRDRVRGALRDVGVQTSLHYPPVHLFEYFRRSYGYAPGDLPVAEDLADRAVTLPLYPRLPEADVDDVCEVIRAVTTAASGAAGGR